MITVFETPRRAKILDAKYSQFRATLASMGLPTQEFRAVGLVDQKQVVVHPDDLVNPCQSPFTLNGSLVAIEES